ncbi:MAG: hypothetical protein P8K80_04705 [Phycisphaerales bacterium]|jgi:hypothetical protein|nr:hypothetical protein [Phycisphaerales bacterium]
MTSNQYVHAASRDIDWVPSRGADSPGVPFAGAWVRHLVEQSPGVLEIKLCAEQEVPSHVFSTQVVMLMTEGAILIDGEHGCTAGDARWSEAGTPSGAWLASPEGARFYLIGMDGPPVSEVSSSPSCLPWQVASPRDLAWSELAMGESIAPPGRSCPLCEGGPSVTLLVFDPRCVIKPHSHPGNIVYIMLEGTMEVPGEGVYETGDLRWGARGYEYGPEIMGTVGTTMIAIQKDVPLAVDWVDAGSAASSS